MFAQKSLLRPGTLFEKSQKLGLDYVLKLNPDRLLSPCYTALGYKPKAPTYGGWESMQIQGHSLGHYLSALAGFIYHTDDEDAKKKLIYTVNCLKEIQRKDGYIGGISSEPFDKAFTGDFKVERFSLAEYWVPWYSVHKIYAGLIDAYVYAGNKDALTVVSKMADWVVNGCKNMSHEQFQRMLYCEHGGMCKVFADLYEITGNKSYLEMAEKFIDEEMMIPAMEQTDNLQGHHANTQIPKFIGLAKLYDITGKEKYRRGAEFFFNTVTKKRSYVIGGNSIGEHFGPEYAERTGRDTCETCNTYNMLELSEYIFRWNRTSDVADFYETALYNHILASQDPYSGSKTYFVSTLSGFYKVYGSLENAFWCCTGTGMENPGRYNRFIAADFDNTVYINLFIDSTVTTSDGTKIAIRTDFPKENKVSIDILETGVNEKTVKIRCPSWSSNLIPESDGYKTLTTKAEVGKSFEIQLEPHLNVRKTRDGSNNFSILYGPVVLAADYGKQKMSEDIVDNQLVYMNEPSIEVPFFTGDTEKVNDWVSMSDSEKLTFVVDKSTVSSNTDVILRPFYDIHHVRYQIYFNHDKSPLPSCVSESKDTIIDYIECGHQQSEVEHSFVSENTNTGYIAEKDSSIRKINNGGGYFQYKVKLDARKKLSVAVGVFGSGNINVMLGDKYLGSIVYSENDKQIHEKVFVLDEDFCNDISAADLSILKFESDRESPGVTYIRILTE